MATETPLTAQSANPPSSREIANRTTQLADLLNGLDNGIRITGLVLSVEEPKEFKGTSKTGKPYSFAVRELQIWTGNKAVGCKDQRDVGQEFPPVSVGVKATFKIKSVRMNGTMPVFEIDTAA